MPVDIETPIKVEQEDIDLGDNTSRNGPTARAMRRAGYLDVDTQDDHVFFRFEPRGWAHMGLLPDKAQEFLKRFDAGETVEPFEFCVFDVEIDPAAEEAATQ